MLGLHQYGAKAGHSFFYVFFGGIFPCILWKKPPCKFSQSNMEIDFGGLVEDGLREGRGSLGGGSVGGPENDVELRGAGWGEELTAFGQAAVKLERRRMAGLEAPGEFAAGDVGEKLLGRPESYGGGSGPGALEGDLAEMEVL